ncbi:MAG: IPTL-CTERM sorting domain-containing protein [Phycisphaerales bacterium]|nr:IPTL-CTERM sorting domain-containing protein [Phycisphaerales bacterium]
MNMRIRKLLVATTILIGTQAYAVNVVVFDDPAFVDTGGATSSESDNVQASLISLGHTVTTFTGTSGPEWSAALAGQFILAIPELENGNLAAALSPAAASELVTFVSNGGCLLRFAELRGSNNDFLNPVFGFSLTECSISGWDITAAATGTAFDGGPASLPDNNGTNTLTTASLPAGSASIYERAGCTAVAVIPFGAGQIIDLGWDWFSATPGGGTQDGGWIDVLGRAVLECDPNPAAIPTVSEWGLIVLALLLLTAGTVIIRRERARTAMVNA